MLKTDGLLLLRSPGVRSSSRCETFLKVILFLDMALGFLEENLNSWLCERFELLVVMV
jgi:hypothetical protein